MTEGIPKPCTHWDCGELVLSGSRCPAHKAKRQGNRSHPYLHTARWERLSKKIRKASPFCEWCNSTTDLSVDHIIASSERPDLIFTEENLRCLCASCNGRRGKTSTPEEQQQVLDRIAARKARTAQFYASN